MALSTSPIRANSALCQAVQFNEYYHKAFHRGSFVPFHSDCLKLLIHQVPQNLYLRIALVRRRFYERRVANNGNSSTTQVSQDSHLNNRHIVYQCNSNDLCGGHGDRIRGMTRAFYMALAFDATYSIAVESPRWNAYFEPFCDMEVVGSRSLWHSLVLDNVVLKREKNWDVYSNGDFNVEEALGEQMKAVGDWAKLIHVDRRVLHQEINKENVGESGRLDYESLLFPEPKRRSSDATVTTQYAVVKSNFLLGNLTRNPYISDIMADYGLTDLNNAQLYHIFLQLFASRPTAALSKEIEASQQLLAHSFVVGLQIRLGSTDPRGRIERLKGGRPENDKFKLTWDDPMRHSVNAIPCMVEKAKELCANDMKEANDCAFFVSADSIGSIREVRKLMEGSGVRVVTPNGSIFHLDKSQFNEETSIQDNMKMFADWFILANRSDALMVSRSSFSFTASVFKSNGTDVNHRPFYRLLDHNELLNSNGDEDKNDCTLVEMNSNDIYNYTGRRLKPKGTSPWMNMSIADMTLLATQRNMTLEEFVRDVAAM